MLDRRKQRRKDDGALDEGPCPECGKPMLTRWGATCGMCRPGVGRIPALAGKVDNRSAVPAAWVVITDSPDVDQIGAVLPVSQDALVLTRASGAALGRDREIRIQDDFMSAGHAIIYRRAGSLKPFSIADRRDPGPSANGTFLNGRRLGPGETSDLCDGDSIRVGTTVLVFRSLLLPRAGR